jgi:hypothetical protein
LPCALYLHWSPPKAFLRKDTEHQVPVGWERDLCADVGAGAQPIHLGPRTGMVGIGAGPSLGISSQFLGALSRPWTGGVGRLGNLETRGAGSELKGPQCTKTAPLLQAVMDTRSEFGTLGN